MLYGSTFELREKPDIKQPCCFFVFDDGIVAIRPPVGSVTISLNEANNIRAMAWVYALGARLVQERPHANAAVFASSMSAIDDPTGRSVQTEAIAVSDIISAELTKNGLLGAKVTVTAKGRPEALVLFGAKKVVKEFGTSLAKPLGNRFITSLK
jgi:hypothetical protein